MEDSHDVVPLLLLLTAIRPTLEAILAELDPTSFIRVAATCKGMWEFARSKPFGTRPVFPLQIIKDRYGVRLTWYSDEGPRTLTRRMLRNLMDYPFELELTVVINASYVTLGIFNDIRVYVMNNGWMLKEIKYFKIHAWNGELMYNDDTPTIVECWSEILDFLKEFKVKHFNSFSFAPPEVFHSLVTLAMEKASFFAPLPVDLSFLRETGLKELCINGSEMTKEQLRELIKEFGRGTLDHFEYLDFWRVGEDFQRRTDIRFHVRGIREARDGEPLPDDRPLVDFSRSCLLTANNAVFLILVHRESIFFEKMTRDNRCCSPLFREFC